MRLFERLTTRAVAPSAPVSERAQSVLMTSFGSPDNERIQPSFVHARDAFANSGVVFACVQRRASLFAEAEFKFQRLADKSLYGSPALLPLEKPWPNGTTGELLVRMEQDVSLAGNAYIRDAGMHLERLRPDWTNIVSKVVIDPVTDTEVREVIGYWYDPLGDIDRKAEFYPVGEVAHWSPIPDPMANFRGMSWMTPVLRDIDADAQLTDYKRAFLNNAATPNLLIMYSQKLNPDKLDSLATQVQARHGGVGNSFKTMILDEGADPKIIGSNFEQMAFAEVEAAGENRVVMASGVPAIVAGNQSGLDASGLAYYDAAVRAFADLTIRPNWRSACASLATLIDVPADSRLWFDESGIAALRQGEKEQADTMTVLATAANTLIMAGYTPESIAVALSSGDITQLKHSGLVSVQMQALQEQETAMVKPVSDTVQQTKVPKADPKTGVVTAGRADTLPPQETP